MRHRTSSIRRRPLLPATLPLVLLGLGLFGCPPPDGADTDTSPSTGSAGATVAAGTTTATSGPDPSGAVTEPTTTTSEITTSGTTTTGTTTTGGPGESTAGVDSSTGGTSSFTTGSETSTTGTGSSTTIFLDSCGDGVLDPGEICDDGNDMPGDGCLPDCTPGTGEALGPLTLPQLGPGESWSCLTLIDAAVIDQPEHGLVLGGIDFEPGPDAHGVGHIQKVPLPAANPATWSWTKDASPNGRYVTQLVTADNGDIIAAGAVLTDPNQWSGFLWLARFTPAGEVVWLRDHQSIFSHPNDLALSPSGDILVAGRLAGWPKDAKGSWMLAFDADGLPLWEHAAPIADEWRLVYTGVVVDDGGTVYATGHGGPADRSFHHLVLGSFSGDGAPLWQVELPAPRGYVHVIPSNSLALTTQGALVVALGLNDQMGPAQGSALAAFDTTGALLWWRDQPMTHAYENSQVIVAAPNGGVVVGWSHSNEDQSHGRLARYSAAGEVLWSIDPSGDYLRDVAFGPDDLLYVLQNQEVHRYAP